MNPVTFRRDRYLRTSAYHLATWSLVAFVVELRLAAEPPVAGSGGVFLMLVASAVLTSLTHERRVGKMAGPAGEPVFEGAGRMWTAVLCVLAAGSAVAVYSGRSELLFDAWMLGVGLGFVLWGRATAFAWYVGIGVGMVVTAAADVVLMHAAAAPVVLLRLLVCGAALPGLALLTNRRFLWFRPQRDG